MQKKSYAKVNIFLKITGKRGNYHELASRFVRVKNLYDLLSFVKEDNETFTLEGNFGCKTEQNTIYKAYVLLKEQFSFLEEEFKTILVKVEKNIPEFAGLGGGSSNCACFLNMCNEHFSLGLSKDELANMGSKIGADVAFFVYEYDSANVSGIGEIVKEFNEESLEIETFTPLIACNTVKIYQKYRADFYHVISREEKNKLMSMKSLDVLKIMDIKEANDLYQAAYALYPSLKENEKNNWYFSGSGSTFFKVKNGKRKS